MKKKSSIKMVMALLAMVLLTSSVFAAGIKESNPEAVTARILSSYQDGATSIFTARTLEGIDLGFQANSATTSSYPVASLSTGDYVEVVLDNGIATDIRYINPLVAVGALDYNISLAQQTSLATLGERFSYTYGYLLLQSFASQGLFFDAGYYVKGALDGYAASSGASEGGFYAQEELFANISDYEANVWNAGLAPQDFGKGYESIEQVANLPKPESTIESFSYTYGYLLAFNLASQGIEVDGKLYASGALDFASNNTLLMSEAEMQTAFVEYQSILEEKYQQYLSEVAVTNLSDAEAFLAQNTAIEGVVTTGSGLQYQVLNAADGPKPTLDSTVEVNYQLQLMDGTLVESSYDNGSTAQFPISGVIPGFAEALLTMNEGSVIRTWIHPSMGYGEAGTDTILPNSLLVFDIELVKANV